MYKRQDIDQEPFFPEEEKLQRDNIRALLWKVRPDLNEAEREKAEKEKVKEVESYFGTDIETVKAIYEREKNLLTE